MANINFSEIAWEEYLSWNENKKIQKKINDILKNISRTPFTGIGKPEPLKSDNNKWSRRIDDKERLVHFYLTLTMRYK